MFVSVKFKNSKHDLRDSEVIECAGFDQMSERINFYHQLSQMGLPLAHTRFMSIALDQVAMWEIVESPKEVSKEVGPDEVRRLKIHSTDLEPLQKAGFRVGRVNGVTPYLDLDLYFAKD